MSDPTLLDDFRAYFVGQEVPFEELEDVSALRTGFQGTHSTYVGVAQADETYRMAFFYVAYPTLTPVESRPAVAEFITRANYGQKMGNFEMDYSDGQVRYKTTHNVADGPFTEEMIGDLVGFALFTVERYHLALSKVMFGALTPEEAIAEVEG